MAKAQKKKAASNVGRNADRRCGKAWKKNPQTGKRVRTPERQEKDALIRASRVNKYEIRKAELEEARRRKEAEEALAKELAAQVAAEVAEAVRRENEQIARLPLGMQKLKKLKKQPVAA